jgi:hypothetical protein
MKHANDRFRELPPNFLVHCEEIFLYSNSKPVTCVLPRVVSTRCHIVPFTHLVVLSHFNQLLALVWVLGETYRKFSMKDALQRSSQTLFNLITNFNIASPVAT